MFKNSLYVYGDGEINVPSHLNLGQLMMDSFKGLDDKIAVINGSSGEKLTYHQMLKNSINIAISLTKMGVKKGDIIAICSENRQENYSAVVGSLCTGSTVITIDMLFSADELTDILNTSKPKIIFCSPRAYQEHEKIIRKCISSKPILYGELITSEVLNFNNLTEDLGANLENFQVTEVNGQTDIAVILYTSGTTGRPKGIKLTHLNIMSACSMNKTLVTSNEMIFCLMPWMNIKGMTMAFLTFSRGNTLFYAGKYDCDEFLQIIEKYRISHLSGVPSVLESVCKTQTSYDVSSVSFVYTGAAILRDEFIKMLKNRFPQVKSVFLGYGMSESALTVTCDVFHTDLYTSRGCIGKIVPTNIIKIVDIETREVLGPNQRGEICIKGPGVMKGYVMKGSDDFDGEGFFRTGDMGYYDDDQFFFFVNRLKDLIKYRDFQIPPEDIESVLFQHPSIKDAAVIGVPHKEGEGPCAFIVLHSGLNLSVDDVKKFVAERLPVEKQLQGGVLFVDEIPRNRNGKILRKDLRESYINKYK